MNAQKILETIENGSHEYYGIRLEVNVEYKIGDCANESRVWDNGEATDDMLNGTSCIGFNASASISDIEKAIKIASGYYYTNAYIIAGNSMEYGEDNGEYIISDAKVVGKID